MTSPVDAQLSEIREHADAGPKHVAVIMDGNGRWARRRQLPRSAGHKAGMASVRRIVESCLLANVRTLTVFAFSQENWQRPPEEIEALMALLQQYVDTQSEELKGQGVRVRMLGDLDRLTESSREAVRYVEAATAHGDRLNLNICISYSARAEITRAARLLAEDVQAGGLDPADIGEQDIADRLYTAPWGDPDLLIRTSGELRISNFLLWQLAYSELYVTPVLWPDFDQEHFFEAVLDYRRRDRRFGRVTAES